MKDYTAVKVFFACSIFSSLQNGGSCVLGRRTKKVEELFPVTAGAVAVAYFDG